ncbi:hypothetical protein FB45DRAFT_922296 [Roridomyces roridus]|uniref:Laccase n=1 Tax=Roridomyces roridus TaxID=1738132 RepID=A0AAD7BNJ2_9AGAR|nr:hypothetical protein FB45DRAFT_922296 [Roridomyces roridus]
MPRVFFTLVSLLCMLHVWAAPLHKRAVLAPSCSKANVAAIEAITSAQFALGPINTANDIGSARNLLQAQLALLDANNGTEQISLSLLDGEPPAPADSFQTIFSGLQAAQGFLNNIFDFDANTTAAVQSANASIVAALPSVQQAVADNCQTTIS